jgi:hypothetical protein
MVCVAPVLTVCPRRVEWGTAECAEAVLSLDRLALGLVREMPFLATKIVSGHRFTIYCHCHSLRFLTFSKEIRPSAAISIV